MGGGDRGVAGKARSRRGNSGRAEAIRFSRDWPPKGRGHAKGQQNEVLLAEEFGDRL